MLFACKVINFSIITYQASPVEEVSRWKLKGSGKKPCLRLVITDTICSLSQALKHLQKLASAEGQLLKIVDYFSHEKKHEKIWP